MSTNPHHRHCRNYAPVDVIKGICHRTKDLILGDASACEAVERLPRCEACTFFSPGQEDYLGTCRATPEHPMTYPDLVGVTCEWFDGRDH